MEISSSDIAPGKYRFQFYIWDYTGDKPRTQLLPICEDQNVQGELSSIMQNAVSTDMLLDNIESAWDDLAENHLIRWQSEREEYKHEVDSLFRFKLESLTKSKRRMKKLLKCRQRQLSDLTVNLRQNRRS